MVISTLVDINGEIGDGKKFWLRTWVKQVGEVRATGRRHRKMARCRPRLEPRILIEILQKTIHFYMKQKNNLLRHWRASII